MAFKPTEEQQSAIFAEHGRISSGVKGAGTVAVSAAAGSGKTAVLTQRAVRLISECSVDADRLLIVTFTNAAAAEMRMRISAELERKISENPGNTRLKKQKLLLSKANICTVDSFCRRIVSEHFEEAGVSPELNLMTSLQETAFKKRAMEETFDYFYSERGDSFYDTVQASGGEYAAQNAVSSIYEFMRTLAFPDEWVEHVRDLYRDFDNVGDSPFAQILFENARTLAESGLRSLESLNRDLHKDEKVFTSRGEKAAYCAEFAGKLAECIKNKKWDKTVQLLAEYSEPSAGRIEKGADAALKARADAVLGSYKKTVAELKKSFFADSETIKCSAKELSENVGTLLECTDMYSERLDEYKKNAVVVDFADIEYAALSLLVERKNHASTPTKTATELFELTDEVLVDEFQDTNDLQSALFYALSDGGKKLFAVGDVKQSIYGFRKADPQIFLSLLKEPLQSEEIFNTRIVLSQNFRSRTGICDGVNYIFSLLMGGEKTFIKYDESHMLRAGKKFPERSECDCRVAFTETGKNDPVLSEAHYIAEQIEEMTARECVTDESTGKLRQARYGDFAVLLRSPKDKAEIFAEVLKQRGIPVSSEGKSGFFDSPDVKKVIAVLRFLNDPYDDISLLSVLMSGMFGYSADDVAELRIRHRNVPLYSALIDPSEESGVFADFSEKTEKLRRSAVFLTPAELIEMILNDTSYTAAAAAAGTEGADMLSALKSLAADYPAVGYKALGGFLRYYADAEETGTDIKVPVSSGSGNCVKIMSVHHSKGLQFPVVFCAMLSKKFNISETSGSVLLEKNTGIGMMLNSDGRRFTTVMRQAVSVSLRQQLAAEELRIFYVAATRAIDTLYMIVSCESAEKRVKSSESLISDSSSVGMSIAPGSVVRCTSISEMLTAAMLLHPQSNELRQLADAPYNTEITPSRFDVKIISPADTESGRDAETDKAEYSQSDKIGSETDCEAEASEAPDKDCALRENDTDTSQAAKMVVHAVTNRIKSHYEYEGLNSVAAKHSVTRLLLPDEDSYELEKPSFSDFNEPSREAGNAIHAFLRFTGLSLLPDDAEKEIKRLEQCNILSPAYAALIPADSIRRFFGSEIYRRMSSADTLKREWRFLYEIPVKRLSPEINCPDGETTVIQGTVDCAFTENGLLTVIDYKTGHKDDNALLEEYSGQLRLYAEALESIYSVKVGEKLIYSFNSGNTLRVE